jgi:hypothetical protein
VQNVALISHGGDAKIVAKEYVSGIDYKGNKVKVHPGTTAERELKVLPPQGGARSRIRADFADERMGGCILQIAGLTVGVEVCLDHIASPVPTLGRAGPYASMIQLLLIPSYGMQIGAGLYCRQDGIVFNVDGRGHGRSHVAINDGGVATPTKTTSAVPHARGKVELWGPFPIPT